MTNWQTRTIRDLTSLIKDGTHGTHKEHPAGIPLLSAKDIGNGKVTFDNSPRLISEQDFNAIHKGYKLQDDDILLTIVGSLGRVAIVQDYHSNYTFQRSVAILRFNDSVLPRYMYHALTDWIFQKELLKRESKGAQGGVYLGEIAKIKLNLPEKPEQQRIVAVLEAWDEYLELLDRKIALKEQLKKGLMQQLLTGKKRLPGFTDGWHDVKLLDLATINKGEQRNKSTLSKQKTDLKSYPVINGGISPSGYTDEFNTESMTITISEGGNSCGFVNLIDEAFWCGGHCYKLTEKQDVDKHFLFSLLKLHETRIMSMRVGSGLPNIQKSTVERMKFHITADYNEQVAVGKIINSLSEEVEQLKVMNGKIRLQKKYLLKNLISGTIRTPENLHIKGAN